VSGPGSNFVIVTESGSCRVAVVTKGHPFDAPAFFAVFDSIEGIRWTHVEHPDALRLVEPQRAAEFDVFVMYDMPGITFTGGDPPVEFPDPPTGYQEAFRRLLDDGKGMVFLHHAVAGWPAWEGYADIVGGRFHYQPATLDGVDYPDSGYRHDVTHTVEVLDPTHPICEGIDSTFTLTDEVYLFPVLEDRVRPLMRSTYEFVDTNFYSADRAIRGTRNDRTGWRHPPGSSLVAWTKTVGVSPIAYLQFGDGPVTYANANFRRILANAIRWAADPATTIGR
jgi:type 1 glutamine amidotransferase